MWGNLALGCYIVDGLVSHTNHTNIGNAFLSDVLGILSALLTSCGHCMAKQYTVVVCDAFEGGRQMVK